MIALLRLAGAALSSTSMVPARPLPSEAKFILEIDTTLEKNTHKFVFQEPHGDEYTPI